MNDNSMSLLPEDGVAGTLVARADGVFKYRGRSGEPDGEPAA